VGLLGKDMAVLLRGEGIGPDIFLKDKYGLRLDD
jgi:hypothetical protein